jgi:release factor glutamine methyltransferase
MNTAADTALLPADALDRPSLRRWHQELDRLQAQLQTLPDKPEETAASTLRALWHLACGQRLSATAAKRTPLPPLPADHGATLGALVQQRLDGTPLAHLTQRQYFMGLEMLAGPHALIPRAETELLARAAVQRLAAMAPAQPQVTVIDVCTGSGNVAAAQAAAASHARVYAADLCGRAVAFARQNMSHLGLSQRVDVRESDLLDAFDTEQFLGRTDVLTCNPPYISTARMGTMPEEIVGREPALAFDGGSLGVRVLQRLIADAPRFLRPGGWLVFEVGLGQGPAVTKRLAASRRFTQIDALTDEQGHVRALAAQAGAAAQPV